MKALPVADAKRSKHASLLRVLDALSDNRRANPIGEGDKPGGQCLRTRVVHDVRDQRDVELDDLWADKENVAQTCVPSARIVNCDSCAKISNAAKSSIQLLIVADWRIFGDLDE